MPFPPLDEIGRSLREIVENSRHDIDWSQHPLMALYRKSAIGTFNPHLPAGNKRGAAKRDNRFRGQRGRP